MVWYNNVIACVAVAANVACAVYMKRTFNVKKIQNHLIYLGSIITAIGATCDLIASDFASKHNPWGCCVAVASVPITTISFLIINFINSFAR